MSVTFAPDLAELTQRGATAALLLEAQQRLSTLCVEEVLKKIDRASQNGTLHDVAVGLCHEIAAFRRIIYRQQQEIDIGRSASRRLEETQGNG